MRLIGIGCDQMRLDLIRSIQKILDKIVWDWIRSVQMRSDDIGCDQISFEGIKGDHMREGGITWNKINLLDK